MKTIIEDGKYYKEFETLEEAIECIDKALILLKKSGRKLAIGDEESRELEDRIVDFLNDYGWPEGD